MAAQTTPDIQARPKTEQVNRGDILAILYYVRVNDTNGSDRLNVTDLDHGHDFGVNGIELVETTRSADYFEREEEITRTDMIGILMSAFDRPFTVNFDKQNGDNRTLRGRLIKPSTPDGYSHAEDLDIDASENRYRMIDHRTLHWLVVDGVKYNRRGR